MIKKKLVEVKIILRPIVTAVLTVWLVGCNTAMQPTIEPISTPISSIETKQAAYVSDCMFDFYQQQSSRTGQLFGQSLKESVADRHGKIRYASADTDYLVYQFTRQAMFIAFKRVKPALKETVVRYNRQAEGNATLFMLTDDLPCSAIDFLLAPVRLATLRKAEKSRWTQEEMWKIASDEFVQALEAEGLSSSSQSALEAQLMPSVTAFRDILERTSYPKDLNKALHDRSVTNLKAFKDLDQELAKLAEYSK